MKLLYIESSPRKERSSSIAVSKQLLADYQQAHPKDEVVYIDLWKKKLVELDGDVIDAKYAILHSQSHTAQQAKAWREVEALIEEFKSADQYVFSLPMWNFGIPYKLKHYIDLLVQPGYTFEATKEGYHGLVLNKRALLIYARGGAYGPESGIESLDLQKSYMESILRFIGFKDLESIVIEPTLGGEGQKERALEAAMSQVQKMALSFCS